MAEATDSEIHREMPNNEMNQTDLASHQSAQQMVELQPLLSSQPIYLSSNDSPQLQHVEDQVTVDIKEMIQNSGDGFLLSDCCIYRVPITLRHLKEEAYTPKVVSVGPFHYGNERLQDMERNKQILFKRFTRRAMSSLDDLVCCVKHLEPKLRASYSETIKLIEQELVKLALIDAGFIIELFIMDYEMGEVFNDSKLSMPWLGQFVRDDLLLLENQLPFFVIEELFNKAFPHDRRGSLPSFLSLTYDYFGYHKLQHLKPDNLDIKIEHFTDLLRLFYLQGKKSQRHPFSKEIGSHILSYNANALQEAGIKLKASMNTYKDVDLLVHKKIVSNFLLGDANKVALLFNGLPEQLIVSSFTSEYLNICKRLNGYCQDPWHKMKATLRHDYCRTPWQIVASIAAIVLLLLTIVQTIFSILQVVK